MYIFSFLFKNCDKSFKKRKQGLYIEYYYNKYIKN